MRTGNTGTAGASAPTSTITNTEPRYRLAAAWQRVAAEAQRQYPRVNFGLLPPAAAFCGYRIMQGRTQADVASEAHVTLAAVTQALSRCSRLLSPSSTYFTAVDDFTLAEPSPWAGLRDVMKNRDMAYRPLPVIRASLAREDWGDVRQHRADLERAKLTKHWARFVASQVMDARAAVRSWLTQEFGRAEEGSDAGPLPPPRRTRLDPAIAELPPDSWHLVGKNGDGGETRDEASDWLDFAVAHVETSRPLEPATLRRIRTLVDAGSAPATVAAVTGVPEAKVRLVTGNFEAGVKSHA